MMTTQAPHRAPSIQEWSKRNVPTLALILLFSFVLTRLIGLMVIPPFIDESIHMDWAMRAYQWQFFTGASNGRLLSLWWMALFALGGDQSLFLMRFATVLWSLIGVAGLYSLTRTLTDQYGAWLTVILYIVAPFILFYDRLAMPDSYIATAAILMMMFTIRYLKNGHWLNAALAGAMITVGTLAKAQGIMLIGVPFLIMVCMIPLQSWQRLLKSLIIAYGGFAVTWLPIWLFMIWRGYNIFGVATSYVGTAQVNGFMARITNGLPQLFAMDRAYFSEGILLILVVAGVALFRQKLRLGFALFLALVIPVLMLLTFTNTLRVRYVAFHAAFLIIFVGVGLYYGATMLNSWLHPLRLNSLHKVKGRVYVAIGVLLLGVALVWVLYLGAFHITLNTNPLDAPLPHEDRLEYLIADSSGSTLPEISAYLQNVAQKTQRSQQVIGLLSNCAGLGFVIPDTSAVTLACPTINFNGSEQANLAQIVNQRANDLTDSDLWIVLENLPYVSMEGITAPYEQVTTFARPDNLSILTLYRVKKP